MKTYQIITCTIFTLLSACSQTVQEKLAALPCEKVSTMHISNVLEGINLNDRGYFRIESPQGVRSKAYARIYFVAGDLYYKKTNAFMGRGVWIMNNLGNETSYYWAMPGPATEWTVYPDATQNKAGITIYDHGYLEALKCTRLTEELKRGS